MEKAIEQEKQKEESKIAGAKCTDKKCHVHGRVKSRGKFFEGEIIRKFSKRVTIEFERMVYVRKYERYARFRTKIHARLPDCMRDDFNIGDFIRIQECRPLSKIVNFVVLRKINREKDRSKVTDLKEKKK